MGSRIGTLKVAAERVGLSLDEYLDQIISGQKRCTRCKRWRHRMEFTVDSTRGDGLSPKCRECHRDVYRETYVPVPEEERKAMGPPRLARRDGDKVQARARINADVRLGLRPDPNDLHCAYCGHKGDDRRHEYHHHLGYDAEHHSDVVPTCSKCHHEQDRSHECRKRNADGTFSRKEG